MNLAFIRAALWEFTSNDYKKLPWLRLKFKMMMSRLRVNGKGRNSGDYLRMQREQYQAAAAVARVEAGKLRGDCVAALDWDFQNNFPDYRKYLLGRLGNTQELVALEYGCGPGRNLLNWWPEFSRIDGVDISRNNLENARNLLTGMVPPASFPQLFVTEGADIGDAPKNSYDFCFSTICLQHIAVWSVRQSILTSLYGALKPDGFLGIQMAGNIRPGNKVPTVGYRDEHFGASVTNGGCDVRIDDPAEVVKDLRAIGYADIEWNIGPALASVFENFYYFTARKPR